ncbi:MAG: lipid II flippase MurJ [Solirubrobacteraceae bacterium]
MQTNRADLADPMESDSPQRTISGIARGAALIASLTVLSRLLGLVRTLVFSQSIGAGCLGTAYLTAYQVPNLIAELALGGALTSAMVPVLTRLAERAASDPADKERLAQISSALLTWAVVIMLPITVLIVGVAGPIASLLNPANANAHCAHADVVRTTTSMIEVFAPQVLFYGLSVVLIGLLQAFRRFTGPALAPVIVNLVLIASYIAFAVLDKGSSLARTPVAAELVLSICTTVSIAALVLVVAVPAWRLA